MKLKPISALSGVIVLNAIRGRWLRLALLLGLLTGAAARFFATASLGQDERVLVDLLLAGTILGSLALGAAYAYDWTHREETGGGGLLAGPMLSTTQYVLGRLIGLILVGEGFLLVSSLSGLLTALLAQPLSLPTIDLLLTWAVAAGEVAVLVAAANLLAGLFGAAATGFLSFAVWLIGHALDLFSGLAGWRQLSYLLPNLARFELHETYLTARQLSPGYYLAAAGYAAAWVAVLACLAIAVWRRRQW